MRTPHYVFKVIEASDWDALDEHESYAGSADDLRDGFIHLSTAQQLEGTLERHFAGRAGLVLLAFESEALGKALVFEPSRGGDLFPHLYGSLPVRLMCERWPLPLEGARHRLPDSALLEG